MSQQWQCTHTSKASFLPRALDDRQGLDDIRQCRQHRHYRWGMRTQTCRPITLSIILKNGLNKPRGQGTVCVLITRDLYDLAVRRLEV